MTWGVFGGVYFSLIVIEGWWKVLVIVGRRVLHENEGGWRIGGEGAGGYGELYK